MDLLSNKSDEEKQEEKYISNEDSNNSSFIKTKPSNKETQQII